MTGAPFTNNSDTIDVGSNDNSNVCGVILGNIVLDSGADVWIVGELYVDGGEIVDNAAAGTNRSGAVYLRNLESVLNLVSGEISNNCAAAGGDVYINNQGTVNLGGGSIVGNEIPSGDSNLDVKKRKCPDYRLL